MVMVRDGQAGVRQCQIVDQLLFSGCCSNPGTDACDKPADADRAFKAVHYSAVAPIGDRLQPPTIRSELVSNRPVQIYFDFGDHAHVALITGYYDDGSFEVLDPFYGAGPRDYGQICSAYGYGGNWTDTYLGIVHD